MINIITLGRLGAGELLKDFFPGNKGRYRYKPFRNFCYWLETVLLKINLISYILRKMQGYVSSVVQEVHLT